MEKAIEKAARWWLGEKKAWEAAKDFQLAAAAAVELETKEEWTPIGYGETDDGVVVLLERAEQHRVVEFNPNGTFRKVCPPHLIEGVRVNDDGEIEPEENVSSL